MAKNSTPPFRIDSWRYKSDDPYEYAKPDEPAIREEHLVVDRDFRTVSTHKTLESAKKSLEAIRKVYGES